MNPLLCSKCKTPVHILGILGNKAVCVPCHKVYPGRVTTAGKIYLVAAGILAAGAGAGLPSLLPRTGFLVHLVLMGTLCVGLMALTWWFTRKVRRLYRF